MDSGWFKQFFEASSKTLLTLFFASLLSLVAAEILGDRYGISAIAGTWGWVSVVILILSTAGLFVGMLDGLVEKRRASKRRKMHEKEMLRRLASLTPDEWLPLLFCVNNNQPFLYLHESATSEKLVNEGFLSGHYSLGSRSFRMLGEQKYSVPKPVWEILKQHVDELVPAEIRTRDDVVAAMNFQFSR